MGKRYLRSIVQDQQTLAATGEITLRDLPVNPLSMLYLTLLLEEPAQQVTNAWRLFDDFYAAVDNLRVIHKGENIIQGNLQDLMMVNAFYQRALPFGTHLSGVGNNRAMTFPLCLGRRPYDHESCFPATSRGNLQFGMNVLDITPGTATALQWMLEAVELIEDEPTHYAKYTTQQRAMTATGRQKVPLPLGNEIMGVLLFEPTTEIAATETFAWGKVKLLKDNVEQYYPLSDFETLAGMLGMQLGIPTVWPGHVHAFNGAAAGLDNSDESQVGNSFGMQGYAYLDFDPLRDYSYQLDTEGAANLVIRGSGDEATAIRYLPLERVKVK